MTENQRWFLPFRTSTNYANNKHSYASLVQNNIVPTNVETYTTSLFSVYPTVSNGIYNIADKEIGKYNVEVLNSVGQIIIATTPNLEIIDITNQNSGFYFVRISSNNKSHIFKILKE